MTLTEDQIQKLIEVTKAVYSFTEADTERNHANCTSFEIKPFKTHWDEKTVREVMHSMQLYVRTWILHPLADLSGVDLKEVEKSLKIRYLESQKRKIEKEISELTNTKL